jgi:hypothetical protein
MYLAHLALTERQASTVGQAEPQLRQHHRTPPTRVTLPTRQAELAAPPVPVPLAEELAATPPRARPMALAMVPLPRLPQAAQAEAE